MKDSTHAHGSSPVHVSAWPRTAAAGNRVEHLHEMHQNLARRVDAELKGIREDAMGQIPEERQARETYQLAVSSKIAQVDDEMNKAAKILVEVNKRGLRWVIIGVWLAAIPNVWSFCGWWSAVPVSLLAVGGSIAEARRSIAEHRSSRNETNDA